MMSFPRAGIHFFGISINKVDSRLRRMTEMMKIAEKKPEFNPNPLIPNPDNF
jgi:hypothetical protein